MRDTTWHVSTKTMYLMNDQDRDFQAIQFEKARSIQDTLDMQE